MEAHMQIVEQFTALSLLIVFLFGITFGVIGGAVRGSRRGALLVPAADDLLSAGARVRRDRSGEPWRAAFLCSVILPGIRLSRQ
jgi:hypothetical protein